ncbi:putative hemoglobin and hemoglobin-haptoglobin-binding protein 3 [Aquicella siphonis]|uniref:Putative hemoglobin and hemoglobin-haptoglobin-binding protein 3 n=1 Tax=Aquicella siphonis TaxID=254247 RepID=A0A5E4PGJ8_9COXI|nr:hypothetical protein [Aquicella siphonis]VVC76099.1 putative hemoglobin and hemoglobin-haptoglobin-binding protein 3 [Aquicella siphonis]
MHRDFWAFLALTMLAAGTAAAEYGSIDVHRGVRQGEYMMRADNASDQNKHKPMIEGKTASGEAETTIVDEYGNLQVAPAAPKAAQDSKTSAIPAKPAAGTMPTPGLPASGVPSLSSPAAGSATQPATQPGIQPATQPGIQPATQPGIQPAAQPGIQPAAQPGIQPATQPGNNEVTGTLVQPAPPVVTPVQPGIVNGMPGPNENTNPSSLAPVR